MIKSILFIFTIVIVSLLFLGCENKPNGVTGYSDIKVAPDLIGVWYKIDSTFIATNRFLYFTGFKITAEGYMLPLAVETSTGKLALIGEALPDTFQAMNGNYTIKYSINEPRIRIVRGSYSTLDSKLILNNPGGSRTYQKSILGAVVTNGIVSKMSAIIDNEHFLNAQVSSSPSAKAMLSRRGNQTSLSIYNGTIQIYLHLFDGVGHYSLGGMSSNFGSWSPDIIDCGGTTLYTNSTDTGSITIQSLDLINMRCKGIFEFIAGLQPSLYQTRLVKVIKNGTFDIPLYR
ncbi:MAG: hypothetical protein QME58_04850 [Bacteroidota bacterium]|nr:hypothetical protein [Bacteroidota bacterium]